MAKMFYTLEETQNALGRNEDEVKQLAREGRLREFRDGPRLMFKADQVEQLKSELSGSGQEVEPADLGPSDSGTPIGLADTGPSGSGITLTESDAGSPAVDLKEDTAIPDLGPSDSGGVPSPDDLSSASASGISVFGLDEDAPPADPSAQTAMSGSGEHDQINLEGVGSGSGLLDLTRESDDTSLGAEVWDEVESGEGETTEGSVVSTSQFDTIAPVVDRGGIARPMGPVYVEAPDPLAPAFGGAALAAFVVALFGAFVVMSSVMGVWPEVVQGLEAYSLWVLAGVGLVAVVVFFIVGMLVGKMGGR